MAERQVQEIQEPQWKEKSYCCIPRHDQTGQLEEVSLRAGPVRPQEQWLY